jgi:hypothetical protein
VRGASAEVDPDDHDRASEKIDVFVRPVLQLAAVLAGRQGTERDLVLLGPLPRCATRDLGEGSTERRLVAERLLEQLELGVELIDGWPLSPIAPGDMSPESCGEGHAGEAAT